MSARVNGVLAISVPSRKMLINGEGWLIRCSSTFHRLDANGRPVTQYLCHAFHQLVRVIADADHCVGPRLMRLDQHCVERLLAGSLSEFCKERDIAAKHRLQGGADGPEDRSGSY